MKENSGKRFLIVDAGMNDLIRPSLYNACHEIVPVELQKGAAIKADVVGPVCETGDFFARGRDLPPVGQGDLVAILDTRSVWNVDHVQLQLATTTCRSTRRWLQGCRDSSPGEGCRTFMVRSSDLPTKNRLAPSQLKLMFLSERVSKLQELGSLAPR